MLTPPAVARLWGVSPERVLAWVHSGELPAINAASKPGGPRPRYLIDVEDLNDFQRRRQVIAPPQPTRRSRRLHDPEVKEYFR